MLLCFSVGLLLTSFIFAQDILQAEVPSLIINNFKQNYPKASDIEWEKEGDLYKAEFEIGLFKDYKVWYNASGQRIKLVEEIAKNKLPQSILTKIGTDFKSYRVDDVKKITSGKVVTYAVDLKSMKQDWDLIFDSDAKVLSKIAD